MQKYCAEKRMPEKSLEEKQEKAGYLSKNILRTGYLGAILNQRDLCK
jgi:hypothetical protein